MQCLWLLPSARDKTDYLVKQPLAARPKGQRRRRATEDTATNEAFEDLDPERIDPTAAFPNVSWHCVTPSCSNTCNGSLMSLNYNLLFHLLLGCHLKTLHQRFFCVFLLGQPFKSTCHICPFIFPWQIFFWPSIILSLLLPLWKPAEYFIVLF